MCSSVANAIVRVSLSLFGLAASQSASRLELVRFFSLLPVLFLSFLLVGCSSVGEPSPTPASGPLPPAMADSQADAGENATDAPGSEPTEGKAVRPRLRAVELAAGKHHSCARQASGRVVCWGGNHMGQLGDGTTENRPVPVAVVGLEDAVEICAGSQHSCARREGGTVACWGLNYGRLGDGTHAGRHQPVAMEGVTDAAGLACGMDHSCVLRRGGTVACTGFNYAGQLGDGTTAPQTRPVQVAGLTQVVQVAAGTIHTCAVQSSGRALCWGFAGEGRLGDGAPISNPPHTSGPSDFRPRSPVPVVVTSIEDAAEVAAGAQHSCLRRRGGTVVCWGFGVIFGQDGPLGGVESRSSPVIVDAIEDAAQIGAGFAHSCALLRSGRVRCWGLTGLGRLGAPSDTGHASVEVVGLNDAVEIAVGAGHSCARRLSSEVVCWGINRYGQLGDGTPLPDDREMVHYRPSSSPISVVAPAD